ncbi:tRNA (adenine(22)-N(1))-methyltransferase [Clostridium sp. C105KSO13]|uniref:tRNA (adenine(22)-N(1))-methyltransferase n=1 Tax=Clostridium sp. C105KSO13 TaxID=1776045 RepID=UPI0007406F3A|nr:class I SAM-dependent methyltransferase [Clostridium sp. C105KSO13]CUX49774.1 tRNA (adenine(22)-N(1))-methyltransferase [Clostridium sp. C105KSO13]
MELTRRMQAVANLVSSGYKMADIGTDHAYIPIYLMEQGKISLAVAMDIHEGPLKRAEEHILENALLDRIEIRLSDGFEKLTPSEVDSAVIAGMGGALIMRILTKNRNVTMSLKECILQPQSEIAKVRAFLLQEGFLFIDEDMVLDEGKFYPVMKVQPPGEKIQNTVVWTKTEIQYGKCLLEKRHPVLKKYLEKEKALKSELLENLKKHDSVHAKKRINELRQELNNTEKGLEYYAL